MELRVKPMMIDSTQIWVSSFLGNRQICWGERSSLEVFGPNPPSLVDHHNVVSIDSGLFMPTTQKQVQKVGGPGFQPLSGITKNEEK